MRTDPPHRSPAIRSCLGTHSCLATRSSRAARRPALLAGPFAALLSLSACHGHAFAPAVQVVLEQEPNDSSAQAQGVGPLWSGDYLRIEGSAGPGDLDGFAFQAQSDLEIRLSLTALAPFADLDLCVWDPYQGEYLLWLTDVGDESGSFFAPAGFEFHVVVDAFFGAAPYDLSLEALGSSGWYATSAEDPQGADPGAVAGGRRDRFESYPSPPSSIGSDAASAPMPVVLPGVPGLPPTIALVPGASLGE